MKDIVEIAYFWNNIVDLPRLNGNGYRIAIDIAINFEGHITQNQFLKERSDWNRTSVSNTLKRLVENEILLCTLIPKTRKIEYIINPKLYKRTGMAFELQVDYLTFVKIWNEIREMTFMSSNNYRVFLDVLLFWSQVSPVDLCQKRQWKISPTYASFKKLAEKNLLICTKKGKTTMYTVNKNFLLKG